jgi:FKBP-type peptidyl-prolyl cis-trans isomerase
MIRKTNKIIFSALAGLLFITAVSCKVSKKYEEEEAESIQAYLSQNSNLNFELKASGLYYLEIEEGIGELPVKNDTAMVRYTGMLLNGSVFDSNLENTDPYPVPIKGGTTIAGFDEGVSYMKEGGKSLFLVPSSLGYGDRGTYWIPGYTPLLFEVEVVSVIPGPGPGK